jgi:hypothetical protein
MSCGALSSIVLSSGLVARDEGVGGFQRGADGGQGRRDGLHAHVGGHLQDVHTLVGQIGGDEHVELAQLRTYHLLHCL